MIFQYRQAYKSLLQYNSKRIASICKCYSSTSQFNADCEHADIVISGGGMVGFATACVLGQNKRLTDKRILLLEKQSNYEWHLGEEYSNRVCALNGQTQKMLSELGVWNLILDMRAQPVKKMQVWEEKSEAMVTFDDPNNPLSHIVENDVILNNLKRKIPQNVEVLYGSHINELCLPRTMSERVLLTLDGGRKLSSDLLIGADGSFSSVRNAMKVKFLSWEYDQSAIVATLKLSEEQENNVAWQKFLSTGPIAILPLSSTRSSLVWSTTKAECKKLLSLTEEQFVDKLNNALWQNEESIDPLVKSIHGRWQDLLSSFAPGSKGVLGAQQMPPSVSEVVLDSRASFPLGLGHSANYVAHRVALVGDAGHRVHPLAGQGVNLGFGDVVGLNETLGNGVLQGLDIGDISQLRKYETARQRHNVSIMAAIDGLYRLYTTSFTPLVLLRSLGLSAVHMLDPLKKRIIAHAES